MEPFMPPSKDEDESVAAFVRRRFGRSAVKRMFDPLMSGIYAGDVEKLSVKSTFKVFSEMEEHYGSVVRGMFKKIKERKAAEKQDEQEGTADPLLTRSKNPMAGKLLSFDEGMGQLTERLQAVLSENTIHDAHISTIVKGESGYSVLGRREEEKLSADHDCLIVATPPPEAGLMVEDFDQELAKPLAAIQSSTIAVVALGFKAADIENPLDGFGYLIPRSEGKRSLGVLWSSSIFEKRNPEGTKLLTVMIGGAHDPEAVTLSDEELIRTAISESDPQLGITGDPVMTRIIRHHSGIPQYNVGHGQRLKTIESRLSEHPDLYLAGNGYYGISANDCIRHAGELAGLVAETIRR
jgi:oxygen-dependent protoporphyrinogen oxidase